MLRKTKVSNKIDDFLTIADPNDPHLVATSTNVHVKGASVLSDDFYDVGRF